MEQLGLKNSSHPARLIQLSLEQVIIIYHYLEISYLIIYYLNYCSKKKNIHLDTLTDHHLPTVVSQLELAIICQWKIHIIGKEGGPVP